MQQLPGALPSMTPLDRAIELTHPAFAILHQLGRFSGPPQKRVCEAILGDLRIVRRQAVNGVVLEIFSRDQQVMGLLLPDAGPAQLLGFDDRTMMYEGKPRTGKPKCTGTAINCAAELAKRQWPPLNQHGNMESADREHGCLHRVPEDSSLIG
jgi:hypothetical protein